MKKISKIIYTVVIILLLTIIGVGIWYLISIKKDYDKKITELENKVLLAESNTKDDVTSNSTSKENSSNIVEKIPNEKDTDNSTVKNSSSSSNLDEKQAYTEVTKMYEIMEKIIYKDGWLNNNIEEETNGYLVTSCKYLDDYNSTYMTPEVLNEYLDYKKIEKRGEKYYCPADSMFTMDNTYISKKISVINIEENKITAKVTATYAVVDASDYDGDGKADSNYNKVYDFVIEKIDGKWKVSKFICPF